MEPRNRFQGMNSASLCSLAGRYNNPIPSRFLAPIDGLKMPAQYTRTQCVRGGGVWGHWRGGGLRQINTCRKVPLQVNFLRWPHFALPSMRLISLWNNPSFFQRQRLPRMSSLVWGFLPTCETKFSGEEASNGHGLGNCLPIPMKDRHLQEFIIYFTLSSLVSALSNTLLRLLLWGVMGAVRFQDTLF